MQVIPPHLVGVELAVGELVEGVEGDFSGAHIVQVAAAVDAQIGADGEPQVSLPPAAPVLQHQPCYGAPLANSST